MPNLFMLRVAVAFGLWSALMPTTPAAARDSDEISGMWSRIRNGTQGRMRDIVEFRGNGTYTIGICLTQASLGWCNGSATPTDQGNYVIQSNKLTLQTSGGDRKNYTWRVEARPDDPPRPSGGRPTPKVLYLTDTNNSTQQFNNMVVQPNWANR